MMASTFRILSRIFSAVVWETKTRGVSLSLSLYGTLGYLQHALVFQLCHADIGFQQIGAYSLKTWLAQATDLIGMQILHIDQGSGLWHFFEAFRNCYLAQCDPAARFIHGLHSHTTLDCTGSQYTHCGAFAELQLELILIAPCDVPS